MALLKGHLEPTVVHRTQYKVRPSVLSADHGLIDVRVHEYTPLSPPLSNESSSNSGNSSLKRLAESTGQTSLDSNKKSLKSHHSSEKKTHQVTAANRGSNDGLLTSIAEVELIAPPEPIPSESAPSKPENHI